MMRSFVHPLVVPLSLLCIAIFSDTDCGCVASSVTPIRALFHDSITQAILDTNRSSRELDSLSPDPACQQSRGDWFGSGLCSASCCEPLLQIDISFDDNLAVAGVHVLACKGWACGCTDARLDFAGTCQNGSFALESGRIRCAAVTSKTSMLFDCPPYRFVLKRK
jgi:hypothetical protein